ncbi:hypothetical protein GGGNBK_10955 [Sporosarcina sp. ANT_H38]|uniref:hypothetical protein n=1 Tax=Sporosarcina sp. ANT_H38 TaxID=2597358 RepID=UPI0011F34FA7|nr:hypothetical protein [Sporosarcina sp. ANT_H38]
MIDNQKKFVEYAGEVEDAILRLKCAMPNYNDLFHPNLILLEKHYETVKGYVAIFKWADGECLHPHWAFSPYEKVYHSDSPYKRFRDLKIEKRLQAKLYIPFFLL